MPDFFADLGLAAPVDSLDEDTIEQQLVPAARKKLAMDRQQVLLSMVLMGINRLIVTDGSIKATVVFQLDTTDRVTKTRDSRATDYNRTKNEKYSARAGAGSSPEQHLHLGHHVQHQRQHGSRPTTASRRSTSRPSSPATSTCASAARRSPWRR